MKKPAPIALLEYLPVAAIVPLLWLLPRRAGLALAAAAGRIACRLVKNYRRVAETNLEIAFGDSLPRERVRSIVRDCFVNFAVTSYEVIHAMKLSAEQIVGATDCPDVDEFRRILRDGRGVVVCASHYSNWYWPALYCAALGGKTNIVVRPLDNRLLDRGMNRAIQKRGISVIPRSQAVTAGAEALNRGEIVALMMDQSILTGGRFVPFFGVPAATARGALAFRQATGCHVVCVHHRRDAGRHVVRVSPPLGLTGDEVAGLARINRYFERVIRADPTPYFWLHPRWKKRPPGHRPLYGDLRI